MKQVTSAQIDQLFAFTKMHLVEHYDLQVELVDHLAQAIEAQWGEDPTISFEEALEKEYKKFGVFGFSGLVEKKQAALQNHYWRMIKKEMITFFTIPKVIFSLALFYLLVQSYANTNSFLYQNDDLIRIALALITLGVYCYQRFYISKGKKLLLNSVGNYLYTLPIFAIVYLRTNLSNVENPSLFKIVLSSVFMQVLILFLIILYRKIIPALQQELEQSELKYSKV